MNYINKTLLFTLFAILTSSCSPYIKTSWHAQEKSNTKYDKILIVAIPGNKDSLTRNQIEMHFVQAFTNSGFNTVSSIKEFGQKGLSGLSEEETYVKLCNMGIELVLTIVMLDRGKEKQFTHGMPSYTNFYYYNRILNYNRLSADMDETASKSQVKRSFYWECQLFDLGILKPVYFIQTKAFNPGSPAQDSTRYLEKVLRQILTKKVLKNDL
jgi:hypothetical protein